MRIPNQVLFLGKRRWPEFDCSEAPLPDRLILNYGCSMAPSDAIT